MKIFFKFIYQYRLTAVVYLLFALIFAGVFFISDIDEKAVLYAGSICAVIGTALICANFIRFYRRHILLKDICVNLPPTSENFPEPDGLVQEDFQNIINRLYGRYNDSLTDTQKNQLDSMEYFTVWLHRIKMPVAAIRNILRTEDSDRDTEVSAELFNIEQYAEMALNYIRLESAVSDILIKKYSLDSMIKQALYRYVPLLAKRGIKLDYQPVSAEIMTDEKWLVFVIEQILSNSVKNTSKGCISILFKGSVLSVCDTGSGIPADGLQGIFEKKYTGISGFADRRTSGLGLYLCKRICDRLGHKIYIESIADIGTTVFIDLSRKQ